MENGYAMCLNKWALDKEIKDELGLLVIISSLCAEKGYCYASNEYFANLFNISQETVSRKIKLLEKKNYITIEYEKRGCEIKKRYLRLTNISIDDYQKNQSTIDENVKENNISINNTSINNNIYNQEFERLWTIYPKKQGKKDALKYFIRVRKNGVDFDDILKGLENYIEYIKQKGISQQYIKQGSTWFNQECWNDDYSIQSENNNIPKWHKKNIKREELNEKEQQEIEELMKEYR